MRARTIFCRGDQFWLPVLVHPDQVFHNSILVVVLLLQLNYITISTEFINLHMGHKLSVAIKTIFLDLVIELTIVPRIIHVHTVH